jgi:hypothetical protein
MVRSLGSPLDRHEESPIVITLEQGELCSRRQATTVPAGAGSCPVGRPPRGFGSSWPPQWSDVDRRQGTVCIGRSMGVARPTPTCLGSGWSRCGSGPGGRLAVGSCPSSTWSALSRSWTTSGEAAIATGCRPSSTGPGTALGSPSCSTFGGPCSCCRGYWTAFCSRQPPGRRQRLSGPAEVAWKVLVAAYHRHRSEGLTWPVVLRSIMR